MMTTDTAFRCHSRLALGTVELGMDYGFRDSVHRRKPRQEEALQVISRSLELGIDLIDTAPSYGTSEQLLGKALADIYPKPCVATKIAIPDGIAPSAYRDLVCRSVTASLDALGVDHLDVLQLHNSSLSLLRTDELLRALEDMRLEGKARILGASCGSDEEVALAAIDTGVFSCLQVPFNALDRKMLPRVFPLATSRNIAILTRSAFLRGLLVDGADVPSLLAPLHGNLSALKEIARFAGTQSLSELALRFCLSFPQVTSVIIGVRNAEELERNVAYSTLGPLSPATLADIEAVHVDDPLLINPAQWQTII